MKITDIKIQLIKRDLGNISGNDIARDGVSFLPTVAFEVPIFTITTDEGIEGTSCGRGGLVVAHALASLKPLLLGEDPLYVEKIWQDMWQRDRLYQFPPTALGVVDVALWDIVGKAAGLPIYQLLGGYRDKVRAYASSMHHPNIEDYVKEALDYKAKGYSAYKLHVSFGTPNEDLAVCRAVREAVGDDMILMLDQAGIYNREEALMVGRKLEELNFYWFEEPIPDTDLDGLTYLHNALDIPIASLEILPGNLYARAPYIARGATSIVRSGTLWNGGITPLKKTTSLAEAFGMKCEIHFSSNPWMNAANLQVAGSVRNCEFYEQMVPEQMWDFGVKDTIEVDGEGYAHVPKKPGIGIETDWEYINDHTIQTL